MDLAAMYQLFQHMGYSQVAVTAIVDEQGIDLLDELRILKDEMITNLCKVICHPGGQIANPNPLQQGNISSNPGIIVSLCAESNMKLVKWMIMHRMLHISCPCQPDDVTLAALQAFTKMHKYELNHTNPEMKPTIDEKDWPKMFESISQYFTLKPGKLHIPLAYVICEQVTLPPAADDPAGNYVMLVVETIACTPHERNGKPDPVFIVNSGMVLDDLINMFHDTLSWMYMKNFVQPREMVAVLIELFSTTTLVQTM
jgi:hypothetical protein